MPNTRDDGPSAAVKLRTLRRDRFTCVYCGVSGTEAELEVDHVHPVSKGGSHHIGNLVTACRNCNQKKSNGELPRRAASHSVSRENPTDGLIGLFLHTLKDEPTDYSGINWQGQIIGVEGEQCLVQLFSWVDGSPTKVAVIPKASVMDETKCVLYATWKAWRKGAFEDGERARKRRGDPAPWHGGDFEAVLAFEREAFGTPQ